MAIHYISNCGHDENGGYSGGKAGDQTGGEWCLRSWYDRPWNCVLRYPDSSVQKTLADLAKKAAQNDKIGYDQYQRDTYWQQLQKAKYDPSKISAACEADCSSGVIANVRAAGHIHNLPKLKNVQASYTGDMRAGFRAAGFKVLSDSKYTGGTAYLLPGDILLNDAHHVATNITKGSKAAASAPANTAGTGAVGTCSVTLKQFIVGAEDPQIKTIQRLLNALGYKGKDGKKLDVDGELGENTAYAIAAFQKKKGMKDINFGTVAGATWKALLNA